MKPVEKGQSPGSFAEYGLAKPDLISRLGAHCSYCEAALDPQNLHVEHIYPKIAHPARELDWDNFLLACGSCNSYKNKELGSTRRRGLLRRYVWPHCENTFNAFEYLSDGRVNVRPNLGPALSAAATETMKMVGTLQSPAVAAKYKALGLAYDGVSKRSNTWKKALGVRRMYVANPTAEYARVVAETAAYIGYFSIWMNVFHDRQEVRLELIDAFSADPACFDANSNPVTKGRM